MNINRLIISAICAVLLLTSCQTAPDNEPVETPSTRVAIQPTNTATAVSATATTTSDTATEAPEPATATVQPTATNEPDATNTAVSTATSAAETNTPAPDETNTPTATAASENTPAAGTAVATIPAPAPPPSTGGGSVPAPSDNNYPGNDDKAGWEARIQVPAGFTVSYLGRVEGSPTSITYGPDGQLYVAVQQGSIYKMDSSGNSSVYASGYNTPTGIAFRPGTSQLFVSSRVRNENFNGEAQISVANGPIIVSGLPCCYTFYHSANGIAFGSDGWGYVGVGARADHGEILAGDNAGQQDELHPLEASILRFNPDSGAVEVYARGIRNGYDVAWDANGTLWASENQPDFDPPEEVHRIVPGGEHGYPWYDCDVCFSPPAGVEIVPPVYTFAPSTSPTGLVAYTASQFPSDYYNNLFVTLWSAFSGAQKVMRLSSGAPTNFATGFAAPIDVTVAPDGSMVVADWATGILFQIQYEG